MPKRRHFAGGDKQQEPTDKARMPKLSETDAAFLALLKAHNYRSAIDAVREVDDINAVDPQTGLTALHWAAGHAVRGLLEALWQCDDLNELALDTKGRYASELAWVIAEDEELGALLMKRQQAYAERTGQTMYPKPGLSK